MRESHFDQMTLLVGFVVFLSLVIFIPLIVSILKKNKKEKPSQLETHVSEETGPVMAQSDQKLVESLPLQKPELSKSVESSDSVSLRTALQNTEQNFLGRLRSVFQSKVDADILEHVEELLYTSDLGPKTVQLLLEDVQNTLGRSQKKDFESVRLSLKDKIFQVLTAVPSQKNTAENKAPYVIMIVGVNGAGKTTTIGKLSAQWAQMGKKVLVAAGDTFRAAAEQQLKTWTDRAAVTIFSSQSGSDPSGVAYDAVQMGRSQQFDVVIIDTAGRLHTQNHLMEELKKIKRVMQKIDTTAPHDVWIVLDANSGQNAIVQAVEFNKALGLTGVILTKMDGTAKGGVAVGVVHELGVPIQKIGIGEKIEDLKDFSPRDFVDSILG